MTFIPKSPISSPEVENVNNRPPKGTRAIFAKSDGWYTIDSDGNELKIATTSDINNSDETFIISANYTGEFSGFFAFDLSIDKSYDEMVDAYISGKTLLFKLTNNDKVFYLGLSEVLKGHALDENGENYIFDFRSKDISNSVVCDIICVRIDNGGAVLEFTESTTFIDAMPVKDSQYLITSGGVYDAIKSVEATVSDEEKVKRFINYGDYSTEPTDSSYFEFTQDGSSIEVSLKEEFKTSVTHVVIPYECEIDGVIYPVEKISSSGGFSGCSNLETVIIPSSVKWIEIGSFMNCVKLKDVFVKGSETNAVSSLGLTPFRGCENIRIICQHGSAISLFAKDNNIECVFETVETDDVPTENSTKLITSGGMYTALQNFFSYIEGYEDEIDSYTGALGLGTWYRINPPQDEFVISWDYYYIFARESNNGDLLQVKICENEQGIYFRTGTKKGADIPSFGGGDLTAVHEWNEWTRTLLSNEIDDTPTKDSNNLITSGGVYDALQNIPSGGGGEAVTQPHYIFDAYLTITDGKLRVDSFESVENITEAFNSGRMVIAQTQMQYLDADENLITVDSTCLIATSPYTFFGVTSKNDHIFIQYAISWIGSVSEAVSKNYVDTAIGNIEASLENIINKYGLGGEV